MHCFHLMCIFEFFFPQKGIAELFIVINHGIDEIHHGLCHTEDVCRLAEPSFIGKEIIGHTDPGTVVLHLQIVEKLIILGKILGSFLQHIDSETFVAYLVIVLPYTLTRITEGIDKPAILHSTSPFVNVTHNLVAARGKDIRWQTVGTDCQKAMSWLYMNIVATTKRLLAVSTDVGSEMALIGRLIGRKTYVTIETIRTVFHLQVGYFVIETGIVRNGLTDAFLEIRLGCQILCLVFLEPLTVVVSSHILQK